MDINSIRLAFGTIIQWLKGVMLWDLGFEFATRARLSKMRICIDQSLSMHKHLECTHGRSVDIMKMAQRFPCQALGALLYHDGLQ